MNKTLWLQPYQRAAVCFYLLTVLVFFLLSPLAPSTSYFSNKRNFLNVYFVKLGWFWTTVAFSVHWFFVARRRSQRPLYDWIRYLFMTLYWFVMTQWLLGPSLIDRMFVATGGECVSAFENGVVLQQATCRKLGGQWTGGHDISGHCFLLIHASLFLWEELWRPAEREEVEKKEKKDLIPWKSPPVLIVLCLLGVWWWMLAMTAVYFHGHYELVSGCFFGIFGWALLVSTTAQ